MTAIDDLRRMIQEPDDVEPWTDPALQSRIDSHDGTLKSLAAEIWSEKAAEYASLVDVTEGNSSRKLSQLQSQALKMSETYASQGAAVAAQASRRTRTRPIERQ